MTEKQIRAGKAQNYKDTARDLAALASRVGFSKDDARYMIQTMITHFDPNDHFAVSKLADALITTVCAAARGGLDVSLFVEAMTDMCVAAHKFTKGIGKS